jgi:hypothetical protein
MTVPLVQVVFVLMIVATTAILEAVPRTTLALHSGLDNLTSPAGVLTTVPVRRPGVGFRFVVDEG